MNISVILPACNSEKFIRQAIDSVLAQDFEGTWELIVVNNQSTDGTAKILSCYAHDSRVRVFHIERNGGYPSAMNLGISHARGKYISRMDADDIMNPSLLRMTHDLHEIMGDGVAFVGCKRYWISNSGKPYYKMAETAQDHQLENWEDLINRKQQFTDVGCLYRRRLSEEIGGYHTYERVGMDVDFWLRLMEHTGKPCLTLRHELVGKRLLPASIIFRPASTIKNNIPREFALLRRREGLPADHRPTTAWLEKVRSDISAEQKASGKVSMPVDIAMINLWLKDYRGSALFLLMAIKRNPVQTTRILIRHSIFGWFHDFIEGPPPIEPLPFMYQLQGQNQPTSAPNGRR